MAFSATPTSNQVMGALHFQTYNLSFASVTSGTVNTGLRDVKSAIFQNAVTEGQAIVTIGTGASAGVVTVSGATSNDTGTLTVFGR